MVDEMPVNSMPLFTDEELVDLQVVGRRLQRPAGHTFFAEGEEGDFALLITKGYVKVTCGKPPCIIDIRGPGTIVGEMAVILQQPRMATVTAFNDVQALYLPGAVWLQFLYGHPRAMHALWAMTADRASRSARKKVESELAIEQQLARNIVELIDLGIGEPAEDGSVVLRIHQQDLASLIGAKKLDSVKKVIARLREDDVEIIATGRQFIKILKPAALREIADGNLTTS
jgi:CRP/FNR family transcriptional regulator, cyclic AMP receptor protein